MDDDKENTTLPKPETAAIPPPDLSRRPAGPPSPLESMPKSAPAPALPPSENPQARVHIGALADETEPAAGDFAPFNQRAIAAIIDLLLACGIWGALALLLPRFVPNLFGILVGSAYFVLRDAIPFLDGQSVGKKAMNLRAVTLDGRPLTGLWEPSLIRNGILFLVPFPLIELFVLLTREDKPERGRRLGDEWAKTKVIVAPKPESPDEAV